jgi:aspartyl protease family protein
MGMTRVKVTIRKDRKSPTSVQEEFLVDSGAAYSVVPATVLAKLGVEPCEQRTFQLANGDRVTRQMGEAYFEYAGQAGTSKVIFGEPGDSLLLGVMTLEVLELLLDPLKRELKPLPMLLM